MTVWPWTSVNQLWELHRSSRWSWVGSKTASPWLLNKNQNQHNCPKKPCFKLHLFPSFLEKSEGSMFKSKSIPTSVHPDYLWRCAASTWSLAGRRRPPWAQELSRARRRARLAAESGPGRSTTCCNKQGPNPTELETIGPTIGPSISWPETNKQNEVENKQMNREKTMRLKKYQAAGGFRGYRQCLTSKHHLEMCLGGSKIIPLTSDISDMFGIWSIRMSANDRKSILSIKNIPICLFKNMDSPQDCSPTWLWQFIQCFIHAPLSHQFFESKGSQPHHVQRHDGPLRHVHRVGAEQGADQLRDASAEDLKAWRNAVIKARSKDLWLLTSKPTNYNKNHFFTVYNKSHIPYPT